MAAEVGSIRRVLAGRQGERAAIGALLDSARHGSGGALVVRGVAGSGKSSLLVAAVADAADMTVLRTSGVESESPLAFAALQRLLWPVRSHLDGLPAPQQAALRNALGEADGDGDRFLAFLGTLSLLAAVADDAPVLVVVDDAHWLDDASTAALLFTARRLEAERIALLFAAREGDARRFEAPDLPVLTLGGVSGADADQLLVPGRATAVDGAVRDRLVSATGGNPLALVELATVLTPEQLAGTTPLPNPLPLTGGVERAFMDRYRRMPVEAQQLLLVACADDTGRLTVVRNAADLLGVGEKALDDAENAGLVTVSENQLTLYHPLVRSAVYGASTSSGRRAVHRALAEALHDDADRRAWHLAAATDRPDDHVVDQLDAVAQRAAARGGHEAASAAWARAAELTTSGPDRGRRLYLAASSAWLGAHPSQAAALANAAEPHIEDPRLRAQLLTLQGQVAWNTRSLNDGYDYILKAAEVAATVDAAMARQLAMLAASLSAFGARSPRALDPAALTTAPRADAPARARAVDALLRGFVAVAGGNWGDAAMEFTRAFHLTDVDPVDDHVLQPNLGMATVVIDDDERGLRLHEQQLTAARRSGALSMVEHALTRGFYANLATGAWSTAAAAAAESLPLAASTGHPGMTALPHAQLAVLAALRGDPSAGAHLDAVDEVRSRHPVGITDALVVDLSHWARALLAAQPEIAVHHLEQVNGPVVHRFAALDMFETAIRSGRLDIATTWLQEYEAFAAGTGLASAVAVVEHGHAVLARAEAAEEHFERSLAAHADSPRVFNRARTELAYGVWLRRARRRVDARAHLRTALAGFEELGGAPWAERAVQELRASGETARRRDVSTATDLTAQERQVATLVRQGLSNRDAAARLFVSPRTIDFHLRNVFTKLGVTSRAELTALSLEL